MCARRRGGRGRCRGRANANPSRRGKGDGGAGGGEGRGLTCGGGGEDEDGVVPPDPPLAQGRARGVGGADLRLPPQGRHLGQELRVGAPGPARGVREHQRPLPRGLPLPLLRGRGRAQRPQRPRRQQQQQQPGCPARRPLPARHLGDLSASRGSSSCRRGWRGGRGGSHGPVRGEGARRAPPHDFPTSPAPPPASQTHESTHKRSRGTAQPGARRCVPPALTGGVLAMAAEAPRRGPAGPGQGPRRAPPASRRGPGGPGRAGRSVRTRAPGGPAARRRRAGLRGGA